LVRTEQKELKKIVHYLIALKGIVLVKSVPASNINIEAANYSIFLIRKISMLNVWPKIVKPSQSTTFSTSLET
jgi:hypothetical protein